jgi:nucleotide-binding universal stress UspA family protein
MIIIARTTWVKLVEKLIQRRPAATQASARAVVINSDDCRCGHSGGEPGARSTRKDITMFEHILVPLDGSSFAECALPHAMGVGHALGARVTLLRVAERSGDPAIRRAVDPVEWSVYLAEARAYLDEVVDRLRASDVQAEGELLEGDPAQRIIDFATGQKVGLIVISTHGQSGLSAWNLSSVVQKVIVKAPAPVIIVRAYLCGGSELTPVLYRRVLVPLDGSRRAEYVLQMAATLARVHGSALVLSQVAPQPEVPRTRPLTAEETDLLERLAVLNREAAEIYLENVGGRLPFNVERRVLVSDDAAAALHTLVQTEDIDLVLLCAHGYTGVSRWPYGSLALNFIAYGATPLLIVQDIPPEEVIPTIAEEAASEMKGH